MFDKIQNKYSFGEFSSQYEQIMRETVAECSSQLAADAATHQPTPSTNITLSLSEKHMKFDACVEARLQTYVDRFLQQALDEAASFIKESVLVLPNQKAIKRSQKKVRSDPYAGKKMQYITDEHRKLETHLDDAYLVTPNLPS